MSMLFKVRFVMKIFVIDCIFLFFKIIMMISVFFKIVNMEIDLYRMVKSINMLIGIWNGFFKMFVLFRVEFKVVLFDIL